MPVMSCIQETGGAGAEYRARGRTVGHGERVCNVHSVRREIIHRFRTEKRHDLARVLTLSLTEGGGCRRGKRLRGRCGAPGENGGSGEKSSDSGSPLKTETEASSVDRRDTA